MVVGGVGRRDEQHVGQVKGQLHEVVPEGGVLLCVQHLQQGGGGVAPACRCPSCRSHPAGSAGCCVPAWRHGVDDAAGHSPDVGLAGGPGCPPRRWTPPREMRASFRFMALAMDMAMEVLPTPGGPTRQMICPFNWGASCCTATNSRMRSLTFSRPKWSASKIFRAAATLARSLDVLVQGSSKHTSR